MKKVSSKAMKHLENVLLTPKGHRDSISYDKLMESEKVTDDELSILLSTRIIKKNTINNVDRFEFTHDILSKYAQQNKEKREKENKTQVYVGYIGTIVTLGLSVVVGWIMSAFLTYSCIPILIISSIVCSYGILNTKLASSKNRTLKFLLICGGLGICLDLIQYIPTIGYFVYGLVSIISLYSICKFSDYLQYKSALTKYGAIIYVWFISFVTVPFLCYGYNVFSGMNYSRSTKLTQELFYIKNGQGKYGIRNRKAVIVQPQYDETLQPVGKEFVAVSGGKCGLLDSIFHTILPIKYERFITSDNKAYFYIKGKEVTENGLEILWSEAVSEVQKNTIRRIMRNMIAVEGGNFDMGTNVQRISKKYSGFKPINGEEFVHKVNLTDYYLSKYEVTIKEWIDIMGYDPRKKFPYLKADSLSNLDIPVYKISYEDCQQYIEKISEMTNLSFSLPTEAQWEYAARGGKNHDTYDFAGSNSEFDVGWVDRNSDRLPHVVGEKGKSGENSLGLSDMTGNVAEFCKDCMSRTFYRESAGATNPCCESGETVKNRKYIVLRGGAFNSIQPFEYIVTRRNKVVANIPYRSSGFRLAINPRNK